MFIEFLYIKVKHNIDYTKTIDSRKPDITKPQTQYNLEEMNIVQLSK